MKQEDIPYNLNTSPDLAMVFVGQILEPCLYLSSILKLTLALCMELFVLPDLILLYDILWIKSCFYFGRR